MIICLCYAVLYSKMYRTESMERPFNFIHDTPFLTYIRYSNLILNMFNQYGKMMSRITWYDSYIDYNRTISYKLTYYNSLQ